MSFTTQRDVLNGMLINNSICEKKKKKRNITGRISNLLIINHVAIDWKIEKFFALRIQYR